MKLGDQFRFVRQNMKKNKTRLFMTVLATAMGCSFLIVLASVGFGLQQSIVDKIVGDRLVTAIDIYSKDPNKHKEDTRLYDADIKDIGTLPNVKAVTYRNFIGQWMDPFIEGEQVHGDRTYQVDFKAEERAGFGLSAGRMPQKENEIVLGYNIRQQNNDQGVPSEYLDASEWLDKTIVLQVGYYEDGELKKKPIEAVVVGITEKSTKEWKMDQALYVGVDLMEQIEATTGTQNGELPYVQEGSTPEQIAALMGDMPKPSEKRSYNQVQVIAGHANNVKGIAEALRDKGYYNHSIADELKQVNLMFLIMKIGLIFIGTIAVLIASIGIFNTMTMAVTERAQDIGIMKAIGAHPSVIRKIFLLESAWIGIMGAIIGTVVSYGISFAVNAGLPILIQTFMEEEVPAGFLFSVIPPYLTLLACTIALGVAMLSGYRPALRATRIDVLRALRRDV
ncbi:ABC transporter permease [Paenibacillus paeoniae]|uniref:ABC transporter permease n=1 Tax=Paenibacillus paeoniae TaxID=2292705 RepID=A0A371P8J5_9BACL|nr:FtsX-like permease family protein [Paenibacillus paeoniae]REK71816.1 ABC transporter permease [Paenibacillus paeoniae]